MKPLDFPKCKQQKDFEDLAINLIKVMAQMTAEKQITLFEFAQDLAFNQPNIKENKRRFSQWQEITKSEN